MAKNVAKKAATEVAVPDYGDDLDNYSSDIGQDDVAMPFLRVLQKGSHEVDPEDPLFVKGAGIGNFFNTVTQEYFDEVTIIPVKYTFTYIEWVPQDSGGGFVADHGRQHGEELLKTCTKNEKKQDMLPNGNQLVATATYVCGHLHPEKGFDPVVISMSSTQLKKSRGWNTRINGLQTHKPDGTPVSLARLPWAGVYVFKTIAESNDKGNWKGLQIQPHETPFTPADIYAQAKMLRDAIEAGEKRVDMSKAEGASEPKTEDEIPF